MNKLLEVKQQTIARGLSFAANCCLLYQYAKLAYLDAGLTMVLQKNRANGLVASYIGLQILHGRQFLGILALQKMKLLLQ